MTDSPTELRIAQGRLPDEPAGLNLGFTLSFISGRGLLTSRDKRVGPFEVKVLELEIPNIEFPFDVTGGSDRFKNRRCNLRTLAVSLDADGLAQALARRSVEFGGFLEVRSAIRDGFVQLGGRFAIGEHSADFTMRVSPLIHSPRELSLVFYDTRLYGWLPVPAALLPVYLNQALQIPFVRADKAGAWTLAPIDDFLRAVLPRAGWKVPDTRHAGLSVADAARGRVSLAAGVNQDPTAKQRHEREPPREAVAAGEGIAAFARAEESMARGDFVDAYQRYRESLDDERGGSFVRERLLQIGAADPELALETRQLAEECLAKDPADVQALLAMAAIAMRERAWGEAATRYGRLADVARTNNLRYDIVAAELAGAAAAAPVDPAAALASYERAAARARDSVIAHQALFEVRRANQDWDGAAKAGERLARLVQEPSRSAEIHRQLGVMHRVHRNDLKRARVHFEKALKIEPDDPAALEGLAETYAARGEPARAATYLARLAEHAEASADGQRIISLNLRLGEIWERWLGDDENASRRFQTVLDADPRNRTARLRLAALAEKNEDWNRARSLYEDLLAFEEERGDPEATSDLVQAYTRLARVTLQTDGAKPEAIACLERAVELDPSNRPARDELARVMRERGEWSRLAQLLDEAARHSTNIEEARRSRLDAAKLQLSHGGDREVARRHLEAILDRQADDPEALELLIPLLTANEDAGGLITRLEQAADVTLEPVRRGQHMAQLAGVRRRLGMDPESQRVALEAALDANPYMLDAAERLVGLLDDNRDYDRLVRALGRLSVASVEPGRRAEVLVKRATILWRDLERVDAAERAFRDALRLVPGDFAAWNQLSRLYESSGQIAEAREALATALAEAERRGIGTAPLHERTAELARAQNDSESEVAALSAAIQAGLRTERIAQRLIVVLSHLDRGREAAELLEEWASEARSDDNDRLSFQAAELRRSLGEHERASHAFAEIIQGGGPVAVAAAKSLERVAFERGDQPRERLALEYLAAHSEGEEQVESYERFVDALYRYGEHRALENATQQLLSLDPKSPTGHLRMAQRLESDENFNEALMYYERLLLETKRDRLDRNVRRDAFVHAAGLAHEIKPDLIPRMQEAFDFEFPEAPDDALDRTLSDLLRDEERWNELYRLRRSQIEWVGEAKQIAFQSDIAELLHHRLDRVEESIPYYQNVIASSRDPSTARDALVDVFERLGRWGDLASHLFAMSQLEADRPRAVAFGLRSARVFGDELKDWPGAQQVLRTLLSDPENDWRFGGLMDALRDYRLDSELSLLTEKSLEAEPSPDDGRLEELVGLLVEVLNDPTRALRWTKELVDRYPQSDDPRRLHGRILGDYPTLGDQKEWLAEWADAREGAVKARVLLKLAAVHHDDGEFAEEIATLRQAAETEPDNVQTLELLVERIIARGDWDATLPWLEQLAQIARDPDDHDTRWRRLIEVAIDYADDSVLAIRGLESLHSPSEDELSHLLQLYVETGNAEGMERQSERVAGGTADEQLAAARAALEADARPLARRFYGLAMDGPRESEVWAEVAERWRAAGHLEELARWRLQRADEMNAPLGSGLRILAYAELLEAGSGTIEGLGEEIAAADLTGAETAWAVFRIGSAEQNAEWQNLAARPLTSLLDESDPRIRSIVLFRADRELADGGDANEAVELARKLLDLGEPAATQLLESALERAGRTEELIASLEERAILSDDEETEAALWLRIAQLRHEHDDLAGAANDLSRVPTARRHEAWSALARELGSTLADYELQIAADQVSLTLAESDQDRARWLRSAARTALWQLGDEARGHRWLKEAQGFEPESGAGIVDELQGLDGAAAETRLVEAFVVLEGAETKPLWLFKFRQALEQGDLGTSREALDAVAELTDTAPDWASLSRLADTIGDGERQRSFLGKAYERDREFEEEYLAVLSTVGTPLDRIELLRQRAEELGEVEASRRYLQAADIAQAQLADAPLTLELLEHSVKSHATEENLARTVDLAFDLERTATVAALAGPLLQRVDSQSPNRPTLLRRYVDALEAVSSTLEMEAPLRELVSLGLATAADCIHLAELVEDDEPREAAELYENAAQADENAAEYEPLVTAAEKWEALGEVDRAASLIGEALTRGADHLRAHQLGFRMLDQQERLRSAARVIELAGDTDWPDKLRHRVRVELARWMLETDNVEAARDHIRASTEFGESGHRVQVAEEVWERLGDEGELASLRVTAIGAGSTVWDQDARIARLQQSVAYYRGVEDVAAEYRALDLLLRETPEEPELRERLMAVMAELGDQDTFIEQVEAQWEDAEDKAELALRYAPVFVERFDAPDLARSYLHRAYDAEPSMRLADSTLDVARRSGALEDSFRRLASPLVDLENETLRMNLELALAEVAKTELQDREKASELYHRVFDRDASVEVAREYVLDELRETGSWEQLVGAYERSGEALPGVEGKAAYMEGAAVADAHLGDPGRFVAMAGAALERDPEDEELATTLAHRHVALENWPQARTLVERRQIDANVELELTTQIIEGFRKSNRPEEAEGLRATLAGRFPESELAGRYRLDQARAAGDAQAIMLEAESRLRKVKTLSPDEWLALHDEAGIASLELGESKNALEHFVALLDTPDPSPHAVLKAAELAFDLNEEKRLDYVLETATRMRELITTEAIKTKGDDRIRWFTLLGQAHERADNEPAAIEAFRQAFEMSDRSASRPFDALLRLYENKGDWSSLVALLEDQIASVDAPQEKARLWLRIARIHLDQSGEEQKGEKALDQALALDPDFDAAKFTLGMLMMGRHQFERAVQLLEGQLNLDDPETEVEMLAGYFEGLQQLGRTDDAIAVGERILSREPMRDDTRIARARLLEEVGRLDESDAAWVEYLERLGPLADAELVVPALLRVARGAKRRGEHAEAVDYLERAYEIDDSRLELLRELRVAVEASGDRRRAAALHEREADLIPNAEASAELLKAAVQLLREEDQPHELFRVLNRVHALKPDDNGLLSELVSLAFQLNEDERFSELVASLEQKVGLSGLDADVLVRLGSLAEADDMGRAVEIYRELHTRRPGDLLVADKLRDLALATEDYAVFVELEEASIARLDDDGERVGRLKSLASIVLKELKEPARAVKLVETALTLDPEDRELRRRMADTYALDASTYGEATKMYRALLEDDPFDVGLLRILARLFGQIGDTDRAFGYYAALRTLVPGDEEAKRFVEACRKAMPPAPPRPITDTDRGRGMIHPDQLGAVEELYAPLARFGELTHPGDLRMRGVDDRDLLAPTDPTHQTLSRALESIGLQGAELYAWRGGGFGVELELVGKPAILLGSMLMSDASERQRAFLVVRAGELYRTGHTLCDRLSPGQLEALIAALAVAVTPDANVPGVTTQSQEWAKVIAQPMTQQIRQQRAPSVHQYIQRFSEVDVAAWRRACLSTAARTALVVCCDIEDAISAMLRLRGFDDVTDEQRPMVLRESPEELDLWKFALSDAHFKLRASLGIALRSG